MGTPPNVKLRPMRQVVQYSASVVAVDLSVPIPTNPPLLNVEEFPPLNFPKTHYGEKDLVRSISPMSSQPFMFSFNGSSSSTGISGELESHKWGGSEDHGADPAMTGQGTTSASHGRADSNRLQGEILTDRGRESFSHYPDSEYVIRVPTSSSSTLPFGNPENCKVSSSPKENKAS